MSINILYNEAQRQRTLELINMNNAFNGSKSNDIELRLKIHGDYTDGFYELERKKLFESVKKNV